MRLLIIRAGIMLVAALALLIILGLNGVHLDPLFTFTAALIFAAITWLMSVGFAHEKPESFGPVLLSTEGAVEGTKDLQARRIEGEFYRSIEFSPEDDRSAHQRLADLATAALEEVRTYGSEVEPSTELASLIAVADASRTRLTHTRPRDRLTRASLVSHLQEIDRILATVEPQRRTSLSDTETHS